MIDINEIMASVEIYPGFGGNRIERISVSILKER